MRLQVEIAAASWISGADAARSSTPAARPSVSATRSRSSSGAVLWEMPRASSSPRRLLPSIVRPRSSARALLGQVGELAKLAVDAARAWRP